MQLFIDGVEADLSRFMDDRLPRAVFNSLFSWRRADEGDDRPNESWQGWWGDVYPEHEGDRFGSKLWLLSRAKIVPETLGLARQYAEEALQWLIDDGVAGRVETDAEYNEFQRLDLLVTIYKPDGRVATSMRFADVWEELSDGI